MMMPHNTPDWLNLPNTIFARIRELAEVEDVCKNARLLLERQECVKHFFTLDLLLREFLNNAVFHGHCSDSTKQVRVKVRVSRKYIILWIADEGSGFDWQAQKMDLPDERATSGRGLIIGACYAQRIKFNPAGNEVILWIKKTD